MRTTVDLRQVTRVIKFVLRICGLWKPSSGSRWTIAYAIYGILFLTTFSGFFTLCMCINLFFIPDLKELTVASYMSLTELALFVKIVYFFILNRKLQKLFGELDEFALEHEWEQNLVRERVQYFFKIMAFYYAVSNGAVSVTEIGSALTPEPKLSYSGWYPYLDWQTNRRDFWIVFGYQCLGMRSTCNMNVTIDSFACFFMFMISVQMEILGKRLNNMGHEKILVNANKTDYEDRTWYIRRLINQIKLHQKMIASTKSFERYFSMAFFTQISFSGMVICSLTNELAHVSKLIIIFVQKIILSLFTDFTDFGFWPIYLLYDAANGIDDTNFLTLLFWK